MITGDYHHTGIAVGRDVGMLKPEGKVVIIDTPPVMRQSALFGLKVPRTPILKSAASSVAQRSFKRSVSFALGALSALPSPLSAQDSLKRSVSFAADVGDSDDESDQDHGNTNMHAIPADEVQDHLVGHGCPPEEQVTAQPLLSGSVQSALCRHSWGISRARQSQTSVVVPDPPLALGPPLEGLRFLTTELETLEASEALHALAEGQLQCAVTGDALEHLLQYHDCSVLETVMQSVVVFSRMKPHQKGQVMDLLGMAGIHQMFQGHARHIPVGNSCCRSDCCGLFGPSRSKDAHAVSIVCFLLYLHLFPCCHKMHMLYEGRGVWHDSAWACTGSTNAPWSHVSVSEAAVVQIANYMPQNHSITTHVLISAVYQCHGQCMHV